MKRGTFLLIIIILVILSLIGMTYWRVKEWRNSLEEVYSSEDTFFGKLKKVDTNLFSKEEGVSQKEFVSPDGKLKLEYSSAWKRTFQEGKIKSFNQSISKERWSLLSLFYKIGAENPSFFSYLVIQETERKDKTLEEIIAQIKKGEDIQVIETNMKEKEAILETKYTGKEKYSLRAKEKILSGEKKIYIITLITFEREWENFKKEANTILQSAHLTE